MDTGSTISRLDQHAPAAPVAPRPGASPSPAAAADATKTPATGTAAKAAAPSKADVKNSVDAINQFLQPSSEVHFSIDDSSGISVVKVVDTETKKVLRQFPSEQSLEIGKNLTSKKGLLIDSKA